MKLLLGACAALACAVALPAFAQPGQPAHGAQPMAGQHEPPPPAIPSRHDTPPPGGLSRHDMPPPAAAHPPQASHTTHHAMNGQAHHARSRHVRACQKRYRSYNVHTDRYTLRPGVTRRCRL